MSLKALFNECLQEFIGIYALKVLLRKSVKELLDYSQVPETARLGLLRKAFDPSYVGLAVKGDGVYRLVGDRVSATAMVWLSNTSKTKKEEGKEAKSSYKDQFEMDGTMNGAKFREAWRLPVLELCKTIQHAKGIADIHAHLAESTSALAKQYRPEEIEKDCRVLAAYMGRRACHVMDGASYHKLVDPFWVPLHSAGGLYV